MSITVRYLLLLALGTAGSFLGGCAGTEHVGVTPAKGFIFTHYRAPMNCRLEEAPGGPSGVPCGPDLKHGQTTAYAIILPILDTFHILSIGWGDAALDSAAQGWRDSDDLLLRLRTARNPRNLQVRNDPHLRQVTSPKIL